MRLSDLDTFRAVMRQGTATKAAVNLGVSQATVSEPAPIDHLGRQVQRQRAGGVQRVDERCLLPEGAEQHQLSRIEIRRRDRKGDLHVGEARGGNEARNRALQGIGLQDVPGKHPLRERPGVEGGEVLLLERQRDVHDPLVGGPRRERGADHRAHRRADDVKGLQAGFEERPPGAGMG